MRSLSGPLLARALPEEQARRIVFVECAAALRAAQALLALAAVPLLAIAFGFADPASVDHCLVLEAPLAAEAAAHPDLRVGVVPGQEAEEDALQAILYLFFSSSLAAGGQRGAAQCSWKSIRAQWGQARRRLDGLDFRKTEAA